MSKAGKLSRKIEIWGKNKAFYTQFELDLMSLSELRDFADANLIIYPQDVDKIGLISLILAAKPIEMLDELGQEVFKEVEIASVWAEITPKTGTMLSGRAADTILSKTTHMTRIRYRKEFALLRPEINWLKLDSHRFDIDYVLNPYFKNEFLEIFCREIV